MAANIAGLSHNQVMAAMRNEAANLAGQLVQLRLTQAANDEQLKSAATAAGTTVDAYKQMQQAAADAAQAVTDFNDALDATIGSAVSVEKAQIDVNQKLADMAVALEKNTGNFDINTQAGRDNMNVILDSITALKNQTEAMAKSGSSAADVSQVLSTTTQKIDDTARAAGMNADQINAMNAQYGLTPKNISTDVQILHEAESQLAALQADAAGVGASAAAAGAMLANLLAGGPAGGWGNALSGTRVAAGEMGTPTPPPGQQDPYAPSHLRTYGLGGYVPSTGPALLHAGEFVLPPEMVQGGQPAPLPTGSFSGGGGAGPGPLTLVIPVSIDGKAVAQATVTYTWQELLQMNRRQPLGFK